ncbi:MAG TPA: CGNR zinc finger domain-containing protein [Gemmatimonadaceae bacterium]|nr:CGNR zinc finger domain-containing protein [Gemmatimonadaceae bacterium]
MDFLFIGERLAIDLLNTVMVIEGQVRDLLERPDDVARWGQGARITQSDGAKPPARVHQRELEELKTFREDLRRGLRAWIETRQPGRQLIALLNTRLSRDPEVLELRMVGDELMASHQSIAAPRDRLYGAIARSAASLLAQDDPARLRKCANPDCRLMFYDVSKAGRRRWCLMQTCGARAKVSAFRARERSRRGRRRAGIKKAGVHH